MWLVRNLHVVEIPLLVAAWTGLFLLLPCVGAAIGRAGRSHGGPWARNRTELRAAGRSPGEASQ